MGNILHANAKTTPRIRKEIQESCESIAKLATKYQITTKSIQNWKKQFLDNAPIAFEPARAVSEFKDEIEALKKENDALAKTLGKTTVERDWAVGKLKSLDLSNKKDLVDSKLSTISMTRQCEMIGVSRSSLYYIPKPISDFNLQLLHAIDEIYTDNPEYGYRFIHQQLLEDGVTVGRDKKYLTQIKVHNTQATSIRNCLKRMALQYP